MVRPDRKEATYLSAAIPAPEDGWEFVDKCVHVCHDLKQNAEIGNGKAAFKCKAV